MDTGVAKQTQQALDKIKAELSYAGSSLDGRRKRLRRGSEGDDRVPRYRCVVKALWTERNLDERCRMPAS